MQKNTNDLDEKKVVKKSTARKDSVAKDISTKTAKKTTTAKKATSKSTKAATTTAKKATEKVTKKSTATKKTASKATKKTTTKATKKATTAKKTTSRATKKTATAKKAPSKKTSSTKKKAEKVEVLEYYDLPYRYNQTVVKILAQTPTTLFVYWDISDEDRKKYINEFGENFFDTTYPVLIVHNRTMNYSFEVEINDFANSWYFNVNDAKCDYEIELGRRPKWLSPVNLPNNYMNIAYSNKIQAPNNHILFDKNQKSLFFRNVKTNNTISKDISKFEFMNYAGRIYNIYDMYKQIYKHEELESLEKLSSSNF